MTWHAVVAHRLKDRRHALLGDRRKPVRRARGQHGVDRDLRAAVGAVLEADGHRQARRQLAVHLALGRSRADRDPRRQVGDVLRNLGVEELGPGRQPEIVDVEQQLARQPQPLVDVEALVEVGIVDQPLPADDGPRLFEVRAHHDHEALRQPVGDRLQPSRVLERRRRVVNRARTDHDDQPRVGAGDDVRDRAPGVGDDDGGALADRDLLEQDRRWNQRPDVPDAKIVGASKHGVGCAWRRIIPDAVSHPMARQRGGAVGGDSVRAWRQLFGRAVAAARRGAGVRRGERRHPARGEDPDVPAHHPDARDSSRSSSTG